jgi:hypothetical protein
MEIINEFLRNLLEQFSQYPPNDIYQNFYSQLCHLTIGFRDNNSFKHGIHYSTAYAAAYAMERSNGTSFLIGLNNIKLPVSLSFVPPSVPLGKELYVTHDQNIGARRLKETEPTYLNKYN